MPVLTVRFINTRGFVSRLITGETFSLMDHVEAMDRTRTKWVGAHAGTGVEARPLGWSGQEPDLVPTIRSAMHVGGV